MAAAISKGRAIAGSFGRIFNSQICAAKQFNAAIFLISRRASQSGSHYDKDVEEDVNPVVVPDHVIGTPSEKYWGPHPATGVFGPDDPKAGDATTASGHPNSAESGNHGTSALDETVRFRQLELEDEQK